MRLVPIFRNLTSTHFHTPRGSADSELEKEFRKMKYRVAFQWDNVVIQNWKTALFQDLGSSLASMEAGKAVDAYGCMAGHSVEQADAEQASVQAYLEGE